jgi:HEAT repeat protein
LDNEEKEIAARGIEAAGSEALEAVRSYCARAEALAWPLKALRKIVEPDKFEGELLSLLDEFDTDYLRNPEPKVQLLQALGEFSSEDVRIAVQPFLTDMSEEVRFSAVTTVLGCRSPESLESLVEALAGEESLRVKNRIAMGIVEQQWEIPEALRARVADVLPPGFAVAGSHLSGKPQT